MYLKRVNLKILKFNGEANLRCITYQKPSNEKSLNCLRETLKQTKWKNCKLYIICSVPHARACQVRHWAWAWRKLEKLSLSLSLSLKPTSKFLIFILSGSFLSKFDGNSLNWIQVLRSCFSFCLMRNDLMLFGFFFIKYSLF
jgi:hypothetical protein